MSFNPTPPSSTYTSSVSSVTGGLVPGGNFSNVATGGLPNTSLPAPATPTTSSFPVSGVTYPASVWTNLTPSDLQSLQSINDVNGNPVKPSPLSSIAVGQSQVLSFNTATLDAQIEPVLDPTSNSIYTEGEAAFSGSNCKVIIEIPQTPSFNGSSVNDLISKQLVEITALTISVHRAKTQVRSFGYINPKGIARGSRTIAGTIIVNRFTADVLYRFLQSGLMADLSKDTIYTKTDQLPPFNIILLFMNEQGYISTQTLFGVEFVTEGAVVSVQDILLEQTFTYMATDMSPMVPLKFSTLFQPSTQQTGSSAPQNNVTSLWKQKA
jgi:hypothetical protein